MKEAAIWKVESKLLVSPFAVRQVGRWEFAAKT